MAFMPPAIFADAFAPRSLGVTSGAARRPFNSFFFASLIAMTVPRCARLKMQRRTSIVAPIESAAPAKWAVTRAGAPNRHRNRQKGAKLSKGRRRDHLAARCSPGMVGQLVFAVTAPVNFRWGNRD